MQCSVRIYADIVADGCVHPRKFIDMTCGNMPEGAARSGSGNSMSAIQSGRGRQGSLYKAGLLLKSYRACLKTFKQAPARVREYRGQYGKALEDIGLKIQEPGDSCPVTNDAARYAPSDR